MSMYVWNVTVMIACVSPADTNFAYLCIYTYVCMYVCMYVCI